MIEVFLIVFIIGMLFLGQRLSVTYKLMLGIPFTAVFMGYVWLDGTVPLHFKVLLTVIFCYGFHKHYKAYVSSLSKKNETPV